MNSLVNLETFKGNSETVYQKIKRAANKNFHKTYL